MRNITYIFLLVLGSCASRDEVSELKHKVADLDAKITQLEGKIDSLLIARNYPASRGRSESSSPESFYSSPNTKSGYYSRCQATTKRGTQCKRSAQAGRSYCWQH